MSDSVLFEELLAANGRKLGKAELNVPGKLNSLTMEMVDLLLAKLAEWKDDSNIAAVLLTGAGEKAFCAGGDVHALQASAAKTPGGPCTEAEHFFTEEYRLDYAIHTYNKPIVAWGDGIVMGGGLGIYVGASHRVVTETSRFAMPEVTIGLYPDVGGSYFLNRTPGQSGRFLALTGASFNAADAIYTGIANTFIARDHYEAVVDALLNADLGEDNSSNKDRVSAVLAPFVEQSKSSLPVGNVESHLDSINTLCNAVDTREVYRAFEALETEDKWLSKAKNSITHGSPVSVLLIDEQLKRSRDLNLADVFRSEILLSTNVVRFPDFAEGVRALLIDKDNQPRWQYPDVASVPQDVVDAFFVAPWPENPLIDL